MDEFLKTLGWEMRLAIVAALGALAMALCWLSLNSLITGPWLLVGFALLMAAVSCGMMQRVWPSGLPDRQQALIDKWKQARSRSTKTPIGRFVWGLGRTLAGAMAAWQLCGLVGDLAGPVRWVVTLGFGVSFGFFGVEAALWSCLVLAAIVQFATSIGMDVSFTDPDSRYAFVSSWSSGYRSVSWFWPIAAAGAAPLWVGIAAMVSSAKNKLGEELAQRRTAAVDRKRIEARRGRLKAKTHVDGSNPLDKAIRKLEEAQERVRSFGRGPASDAGPDAGDGNVPAHGAEREMTGVERLENENMMETLKRYAEQVASIRESQRQGLDVDTSARHGFDRVIQNMSDAYLEHLRVNPTPAFAVLLQYHDEICSLESVAMRGGDGEVVTSGFVEAYDEEDLRQVEPVRETSAGEPPVGYGALTETPFALPSGRDVLDDDDDPHQASPMLASAGGRSAAAAAGMTMMLAERFSEGEDGTPVGTGVLPVDDDVSDEETGSMHIDKLSGINEVGDPTTGVVRDPRPRFPGDDIVEFGVKDVIFDAEGRESDGTDEGSEPVAGSDASAQASDDDAASDDAGVSSQGEDTGADDGIDAGAGAEVGAQDGNVDVRDDGVVPPSFTPIHASEPSWPSSVGIGTVSVEAPPESGPPDTAGSVAEAPILVEVLAPTAKEDASAVAEAAEEPPVVPAAVGSEGGDVRPSVSADELRNAAGAILGNKTDREMVLRTMDWFDGMDSAAAAIGLPSVLFVEHFAKYDQRVQAARLEKALESELDGGSGSVESIERSVEALSSAEWDSDADLIQRARSWVAAEREAIRVREETARLIRLEEERIARIEAETAARLAREAAVREEQERIARAAAEAEAARIAQLAREAAEEARVEAARREELERMRSKYAIQILAGQLDDDVLDAGAELFPDVETLAGALDLRVDVVAGRFREFSAKSDSRQKYKELAAAFRAEDLNAVEALLEDKESFASYVHPSIEIDAIANWAHGVREHERVKGLIDADEKSVGVGGGSQRAFMIKRTRLDPAVARIVDVELPNQIKLVNSLTQAVELLGSEGSAGMAQPLANAKAQVAALAARVIEKRDGKDVAREYVLAFLPAEVKVAGMDGWEQIVGLAASHAADADEEDAARDDGTAGDTSADGDAAEDREQDGEPAATAESAQSEDGASDGDDASGSSEDASGDDRPQAGAEDAQASAADPQRLNIEGGFEILIREKSLEDVRAMDQEAGIRTALRLGSFDPAASLRKQKLALSGIFGSRIDDLVKITDEGMYVSILGASREVIGRVLVQLPFAPAPIFYHESSKKVIMRDVLGTVISRHPPTAFINNIMSRSAPNGDPEEIVGVVVTSPIIGKEGLVSFQPLIEGLGDRVVFLNTADTGSVAAFVERISKLG